MSKFLTFVLGILVGVVVAHYASRTCVGKKVCDGVDRVLQGAFVATRQCVSETKKAGDGCIVRGSARRAKGALDQLKSKAPAAKRIMNSKKSNA